MDININRVSQHQVTEAGVLRGGPCARILRVLFSRV